MKILIRLSFISIVKSIIPNLFGGGCLLENDQLIYTSGFTLPSREILNSYKLNINNIIGNRSQLIEWEISNNQLSHPGDLVPIQFRLNQYILVYVMGGLFNNYQLKPNMNTIIIQRRQESTLSQTSLVKFYKNIAPDPERYYLQHLENNLRIGAYYKKQLFILENLSEFIPAGSPLNIISVYNDEKNSTELVTTKGSNPINKPGLTATQESNRLIITGGKSSSNSKSDNLIFILNLDTLTWESHSVEGLVGTMNGCLYLHNDLLIHAFGIYKGQPSHKTQLIDTKLWKLIENHKEIKSNGGVPITSIILAVVGSLCALVLILAGFFYYRWRQHREALKIDPPNYIDTAVWTQLETNQFQADMELSTNNPDSFYDDTLISPHTNLSSSSRDNTAINN